jgi:predicted phage gp36 major capsid-like protein
VSDAPDPDPLARVHELRELLRSSTTAKATPAATFEVDQPQLAEEEPGGSWSAGELAAQLAAGELRELLQQQLVERDTRIAALEREVAQLRAALASVGTTTAAALGSAHHLVDEPPG